MIPLKDNISSERVPVVNYALIAVTGVAFAAQLLLDPDGSLVLRYGMVPKRVLDPNSILHAFGGRFPAAAVPEWLTLLTCVFLHGGWLHFLGNVWILFIFGDNVEDRLGRVGYLGFYLASGLVASLTHLATNTDSTIPTIGASGAIAGVMGAYFLLYPRATVLTLIPLFIFIEIIKLPAAVFLGFWFLLQILQGTAAFGSQGLGGVAWWAHIGGFVAGFALTFLLKRNHMLRERVRVYAPRMERRHYRIHYPNRRRR